jgi:DNA-directed RNA polymerase subunit N (RpoN/RPB10)
METMERKPRQQPIQCWSCGEDHMSRYFPQRGYKVRIAYSIQQVKTFEDMGMNVPRIYATLDNKQVEFQSHMIELESKINDQPIIILIDSGASHSYLDPNMVEIF